MSKLKRIYQIDLFRFLAAVNVVLFHYLYFGNAAGMSNINFNEVGGYFKYGYLGVDLFFIISGFVIALSVKNNSLKKFAVSRFVRLYPAYWIFVFFTFLVIYFFGFPNFSTSLKELAFNLTMAQSFFDYSHIDGVYWTLVVELKFYILIALFLILNKFKKVSFDHLIYFWLILTLLYMFFEDVYILKVIHFLFIFDYSSYFLAGILFYQILKNGLSLKYITFLIVCLGVSLYYGVVHIEYLEKFFYPVTYSPYIIAFIICLFYVLMLLVSIGKLNFMNSPKLLKIGILTYPLYLVHQNVGYIIFNNLGAYVNKYILVFGTIISMMLIAYWISKDIEPRIAKFMQNKINGYLESEKFGNYLKSILSKK